MSPTTTAFLPFHRALIEEEEISAVIDVLRSGWLTTGSRVKEFETAFARYTRVRHALAVNSCTAALHLALAAIGIKEGDEIILPTMTFAASGEVVLYFKARPVLVDCLKGSFHMDPAQIERSITCRTRAILPVHYAGFPCDMEAILEIAHRRGLKVIEDAAHALPSRYKGKMVGAIGDITCFSFYATKTLTTGEGGMATTDNQEYADRMRTLSLHGISRDAWKRYTSEGTWRYDILEAGYKYNLTDLQAAIGIAQLAKCDAMQARRVEIARQYHQEIATLGGFATPEADPDGDHAWHLYVVQVSPTAMRITRDRVIEELKQRGIGTSVHFIPLHLHTLYRERLGYREGQFPNAEERFSGAISLPIYPAMGEDDVNRVLEALRDINREFRR
ncbi:MAG: UDP-4-amino-4,6-dideoxy-N-acetyl-beta-L-altrosamine transaminase [Candidatus Acidiferrum sp.]